MSGCAGEATETVASATGLRRASAPEGLAAVKAWRPDLLISDIGMPGEDGYDLMHQVRALEPERGGAVPSIALTGYASSED